MRARHMFLFTTVGAAAAFATLMRESPAEIDAGDTSPRAAGDPVTRLPLLSAQERTLAMQIAAADPLVRALTADQPLVEATRPLQAGMFVYPTAVRDRDPIGRCVWVQVRLAEPLAPQVPRTWRQLIATWRTGDVHCTSYNQIWTQDYTAALATTAHEREVLVEVHLPSRTVISLQPANAAVARRDMLGDPHYLHRAA